MAISAITCVVVNDGKDKLIDALVNNTSPNILKFRIGDGYDGSQVDAQETDSDLQVGAAYALEKDITSKTKLAYNQMQFTCTIDPSDGAFTGIYELGLYVYDGTNYTLFIYATFPAIDKNSTTGLEFDVTLTI